MTTLTETTHAGGHILSEPDGLRGRVNGTLILGQNRVAGAVLGQITKALAAAPVPTIVGTGTGAMTALTFGPDIQVGAYVITLLATSATAAFSVVAPDGTALPNGVVGTAYVSTHISFLVSSAGTMTIADAYTLTVTAGGTPVLVGTGTGVVSGVSLGPDAQNGAYRVQLLATSATGEFEVIAPLGRKLRRGQVATAYTSSHVNFTLANGGTMTIGDVFYIIVAKGSLKWTVLAPTTYNGSHVAAGVLYAAVNATDADQQCVLTTNNTSLNINELIWPATIGTAGRATAYAQLAERFVTAR